MKAVSKTDDELIEMSPEDVEDLVLNYQREEVAKGTPNNTILGIITSPRALFKFLRKPLVFSRGSLVALREARDKHVFSNGDLGKLFDVADVRGKALISLGVSLGWVISDVLTLDKTYIETLISRAKESNERFIFFNKQRKKTNAKALGIINPLTFEWLDKWIAINEGNSLFNISDDQVNKELQRLTNEAQLKTTGNVSFHCFRAWTFSSLVKAGFSDFESKLIVGKKIPLSEGTYLHLEESIKEKYIERYEKYLNIKPSQDSNQARAYQAVERENKELRARLAELQKGLNDLQPTINMLVKDYQARTTKAKEDEKVKVNMVG